MRGTRLLLMVAIVGVLGASMLVKGSHADGKASLALTGQVTSAEEGAMEGVLVSAKKTGSTITTTVFTDEKGRYQFPASRLDPGHYTIRIRATGYDLAGPDAQDSEAVDIPANDPVTLDLKLRKTADLAAQLTNAEWLVSFPGTTEQKASVQNCSHCHTLEPVVRSHHDAAEFEKVLERMSHYTPESFPLMPQPHMPSRTGGGELNTEQQAQQQENRRKQAEYLATLNLSSSSQWSYALKAFPRVKGLGNRAGAGFRHHHVARAHQLGHVVDESEQQCRRGQALLLQAAAQLFVSSRDDDKLPLVGLPGESAHLLRQVPDPGSAAHHQDREPALIEPEAPAQSLFLARSGGSEPQVDR